MTQTIGELLFDGYEDTIMEIGSSLGGDEFEEYDDEMDEVENAEEVNKVPMDKFGWFYTV